MKILCALVILLTSTLQVADGTTYVVAPDGTGDFPTIQDAIDAATDGDVIALTDGTFTGAGNRDLDLLGKGLTLRSLNGDPAACIIDCQGSQADPHRALNLQGCPVAAVTISGMTLKNGRHFPGGAVRCDAACPIFERCVFTMNSSGEGGAVNAFESWVTFEDCAFTGNVGEGLGGGIRCEQSTLELNRSVFTGNYGGSGGAVSSQSSTVTLSDCDFVDNRGYEGGAVTLAINSRGSCRECEFMNNQGVYGGAVAVYSGTATTFLSCRFEENIAQSPFQSKGGAVLLLLGDVTVQECVFVRNRASDGYEAGCLGGAVYCEGFGVRTFSGCRFVENVADGTSWAAGGAVFTASDTEFSGCVFAGNEVIAPDYNQGGAVYFGSGGLATMVECTVVGSGAAGDGAVHCRQTSPTFERTIVAFSQSGMAVLCSGSTPILRCCDVYGNPGGDWVGCIDGQEGVEGNFSADPHFCDAANGDYTLSPDSPCLPGNHPDGIDCGLIGALGLGCEAPATGACCFADGSCIVAEQADCEQQNGIYQGDGSTCEPNPCEPTVVVPESWGSIKRRFR